MRAIRFLTILFLLACTSAAGAAQTPITFVVHGSTTAVDAYKVLFERFTDETGISVDVVRASDAITNKWEQIIVWTTSGISPDIVSAVSTEFAEYASIGLLESLNPWIQRDEMPMNELVPSFVEALQLNNEQFLLPYGSSAMVWLYNPDHFDMAGLDDPPTRWDSTWTYDAFTDTARKLTLRNDDDTVKQWGIAGWPVAEYWQTVPYAFGGRWVSDDLQQFLGTSEITLAAIQNYADLAFVDRVLNEHGGQSGLGRFGSGQDSMTGAGTWALFGLRDVKANWNIMPSFTYEDNAPAGVIFPVGYGMLAASQNKEAAWELMKWLTWNEEANFEYAKAGSAVPSLLTNLPSWIDGQRATFGENRAVELIAEQAQSYYAVVNIRKVRAFSRIDPIINAAVRSVFTNERDARTAMLSVEDTVNRLIQEAN